MSQAGSSNTAIIPLAVVETLTGNSGGAVGPSANNINTIGAGSITIVGNPGTNTLTAQLTGLTNHAILVGAGSSTITNIGPLINGQLLIGSTGIDPVGATLTAGTGISITNAAGSITIAANGSTVLETLTGNTGGAISPTTGNINTLGTGSITIAGTGSTLTTQLTGLTNHNVLIGAGTATITNVAPSATSGIPLISQGSTTDPLFGTALVVGGGTGVSSFNIDGVVISNTTTTGSLSALTLANGQLVIGSTSATPVASTLTAGAGINITNGAGSITITATGAGFSWSDNSGTFAAVKENGYFITATSTATLPASPTEGDTISFIVDTAQFLTITANTGQKIRLGSTISAAAGTCVNNVQGDAIELVYRSTGTTWFASGSIGTWTIT